MKKYQLFAIIFILTCFFPGCSTTPGDRITQTSTIDALLAGVYDGEMSCRELLDHGNFGIGTFNRLDGEMIALDGKIYQVKSDGKVYTPETDIMTPFATVCAFQPDTKFSLPDGTDFYVLKLIVD